MNRILSIALVLAVAPTVAMAAPPPCGGGNPLVVGQRAIDAGDYQAAVATFGCVIDHDPLEVDAYRGLSEAELLLGDYAEAFHTYARLIAAVQPEDIDDLSAEVLGSYDARLASPDLAALTGASFARWVFWEYPDALPLLDAILEDDPDNVYAHLFRGSNRLFAAVDVAAGQQDLEVAIGLAPDSPDVRYIVADAYTYAYPDLDRAWDEAALALAGGLDTPRVHAILATVLNADGDLAGAADHIARHLDLVQTSVQITAPLAVGQSVDLSLWPGRVHEIPIVAGAGETIAIETGSTSWQVWDSIAVLVDPSGDPVVGSDDAVDYFAAIAWEAPVSGTYTLRVSSFEAITTGPLWVARD